MRALKVGGSTIDLAEIDIDFKTDDIKILNVPEETMRNRVSSGVLDWLKLSAFPLILVFLVFGLLSDWKESTLSSISVIYGLTLIVSACLHIDTGLDKKLKAFYARSTGVGRHKDSLAITELNTKEFVIQDVGNIVTEFEVSGDFEKHLNKIQIREEHSAAYIFRQGRIKTMNMKDDWKGNKKWNLYFIFDKIPKKGELLVRWA